MTIDFSTTDPQPYIIAYLYLIGGLEIYQQMRARMTERVIDRIAPDVPNAMGVAKALLVIFAVAWPIACLWALIFPKKSSQG